MKSTMSKMLSVSSFVAILLAGCGNEGANNSQTLSRPDITPTIAQPVNCCITEQFWGTADNFASAPDQESFVSPNFAIYLPTAGVSTSIQADYDQILNDKHFVRSIKFGESQARIDAMCHFSIKLHLKTLDSLGYNDSIIIRANNAGIGNPTVPVTYSSVGSHANGTVYDLEINLKPFSAVLGGKSYIDVRVQDDTAVDYMVIRRGKYCGPTHIETTVK